MSGTESDDPDLLAIEVDGKRLTGWKTASVTRTIEGFPSSFLLTAADPYPATPTAIPVVPGAEVTLKAGEDLLVTGYIDRVNLTYSSPVQHDIAIQGRGRGQDLVDCSADLTDAQLVGGQVSAASFAQLAERLCRPHGIKTRLVGSDPGPVIPSFAVALGETPYEVIDRVARYARFICWEDAEGRLVLDKIGTEEMASGLVQGVNIESATVMFGIDQRFSQYLVVYNPLARFAELGDAANQRAFAKDPTMPRYRPRIIVSPQLSPEFDIGKALAEWELARRIGRSQAVSVTVPGWRDSDGKLWAVNHLVEVNIPALKVVDRKWLIGAVTYRKSHQGTQTDLMVMPRDGFLPAPTPMQLFDWQVQQGLNEAEGGGP